MSILHDMRTLELEADNAQLKAALARANVSIRRLQDEVDELRETNAANARRAASDAGRALEQGRGVYL